MYFLSLTHLLLPTLCLGAALINTRQTEPCAPVSYAITNYRYTSGPAGARITFDFQSTFSDPSIIEDPASAGAVCDANSPSGTIPTSNACSTGRQNLGFDLRAPQQNHDFQIFHDWRCNGQEWMSSTPHKIENPSCTTDPAGTTTCTDPNDTFAPQNVRRICGGPTCL